MLSLSGVNRQNRPPHNPIHIVLAAHKELDATYNMIDDLDAAHWHLPGWVSVRRVSKKENKLCHHNRHHDYVALVWPQKVHAFDFAHLRIGINRCPCLHSGLDEA